MAVTELDEKKSKSFQEKTISEKQNSSDTFIKQYFSRISPSVAATFTDEQKHAIKQMFGARGYAQHPVELRRSIPFGRNRFYLIFLLGRERRTFERLKTEGQASGYIAYALASAFWIIPAVLIATLFNFMN